MTAMSTVPIPPDVSVQGTNSHEGSQPKATLRILFFMHFTSRLRNFDGVVTALAARRHKVILACREKGKLPPFPDGLRIACIECPINRSDKWDGLISLIRRFRDYLRYLDRRYHNSNKLRRRALYADPFVASAFLTLIYRVKFLGRSVEVVRRFLAWIEGRVPSDRVQEDFLREQRPDVVLVTPLVQRGMEYQADYIKAAHKLGIPVAFLPFSWDNLTNKGLMRVLPDRTFVWNETQKTEATEFHGMPAEGVEICGAWRFDEFYAMKPKMSREEFCRLLRIDPGKPIITYLGSSEFVAPDEFDFIRRWIQELRTSHDSVLRGCGVIVKPYPDHEGRRLASVNYKDLPQVGLLTDGLYGHAKSISWGDQALYDCLFHSAAVVGLNTSAMIEAAILSKPVHTLIVPEYHGGQSGTLHFHYFTSVGGGLLHVANDFDEHCRQLSRSLNSRHGKDSRSDAFARAFVRPAGLDEPATPKLVDAIERLARSLKAPREGPIETWVDRGVRFVLQSQRWWLFYRLPMGRKFLGKMRSGPGPAATHQPVATIERLDYGPIDVYIRATTEIERNTRVKSCAKEPWTVAWLEQRFGAGEVLYDIGANVGTFSILAAKLARGAGKVIAFEPGAATFAHLCDNIVLNDCAESVVPIPVPLSGSTGLLAFHYRSLDPGQSRHVVSSLNGEPVSRAHRYAQPMLGFRLDDLVRQFRFPAPTHIKLDVDGAELDVLRGASSTLENAGLKTILAEIDSSLTETVVSFLKERGFDLADKYQGYRPNGEAKPAWYGLFVRKDGLASR